MDLHKVDELERLGYEIPACCGLCQFGTFVADRLWGMCDLHQYAHLKHTGPDRKLSVHRFGCCRAAGAFQPNPVAVAALGAFVRFFRGGESLPVSSKHIGGAGRGQV